MKSKDEYILAINGGSSSIKFALYLKEMPLKRCFSGKVDRIGLSGTTLTFSHADQQERLKLDIGLSHHRDAVDYFLDWLGKQVGFSSIKVAGHRVVHGMKRTEPEFVTGELLRDLRKCTALDPDHLPIEIDLIEALSERHPETVQIVCFDTTFHRTMPRTAQLLPIPRRFDAIGIRRYGFHGLSCMYLMKELSRIAGSKAANGKVILAHLGNGASMTAACDGKSIDTSMGFTPASGLPMGTRPGDLDPGLAWYLMQNEKITPEQFNSIINHESGLLGISETSSDIRDLLRCEASDSRAAEAVEFFCYQIRKWIGAFSAALGGLETIVFSGGIGENSHEIRARALAGLEFLGIGLDERRNAVHAPIISSDASSVTVRVIATDEEWIIADSAYRMIRGEDQT